MFQRNQKETKTAEKCSFIQSSQDKVHKNSVRVKVKDYSKSAMESMQSLCKYLYLQHILLITAFYITGPNIQYHHVYQVLFTADAGAVAAFNVNSGSLPVAMAKFWSDAVNLIYIQLHFQNLMVYMQSFTLSCHINIQYIQFSKHLHKQGEERLSVLTLVQYINAISEKLTDP